MNKRIGFFAGAFDPIHDGHVEVAKSAMKELELQKVFFMVEEKPWGDKKPVELLHRKNMVDLALEAEENISRLDVSEKQFNIDSTLKKLEHQFAENELYFILGADVFMQMNEQKWPQLQDLIRHYIVVFERKNITELEITEKAKNLGIVAAILSSQHSNHSSTDVRLQSHNKSMWVCSKVADYIDKNLLYNVSDSKFV